MIERHTSYFREAKFCKDIPNHCVVDIMELNLSSLYSSSQNL